jgi:4-alpha-glucanotransferase
MRFARSGGILLHLTSLPGPYGIGDLGPQAHEFADWLEASGCKLWQVLPLGPTGYGNSPYQCHSVFAGNPYLISPDLLQADGLVTKSDLADPPIRPSKAGHVSFGVDYGRLIPWKLSLLRRAFERFQEKDPEDLREQFAVFRAQNASWLEDFALFMALKESQGGLSWSEWPVDLRRRHEDAVTEARRILGHSVSRFAFYQFLFFRQWTELLEYAHKKGICIIGDAPIFAAQDSADVWVHPELFCLNQNGSPTVVSGVPPDYFSPTGQLWGNPLYRWEAHRANRYAWWVERLRATLGLVDIVRLDHFRGFSAYWEIPAGNPTAEIGRWVPGPAEDFFDAVQDSFSDISADDGLPIIAEDLGVITPGVVRLRDRYHLPGMKILQFGFSGPDNLFLPHNYVRESVAYTGTHDNNTARGWFRHAPAEERAFALRYLDATPRSFVWDMIRSVWSSIAVYAIAPMQDLLALGSGGRMNYPSRPRGNWEWRMREDDLSEELGGKIRALSELYSR